MRLWLIKTDDYDYDEYDAFVVCAESEERARELAQLRANAANTRQQEFKVFLDPLKSTCRLIETGEPCIVLGSFNAG